jgi:hypothetical protein
MQFGKIHGVALIVLGAVLLCIQTMPHDPGPFVSALAQTVGFSSWYSSS